MASAKRPTCVGNLVVESPKSSSFDRIAASHNDLIRRSVSKQAWRLPDQARADLEQAATLALWRAVQAFDPNHGVPFEHYAARSIRRAVTSEASLERDDATIDYGTVFACGEVMSEDDSVFSDPPIPYEIRESGSEQFDRCLCFEIAAFVSGLTPALRAVYHAHICEGHSQSEVAEILGVTQQRVAKLKAELLSEIQRYVGGLH